MFEAKYFGRITDGAPVKAELPDEAVTQSLKEALEAASFTATKVKKGEKRRMPPPPFTTSTLQQDASRRLNMPSKRTMAVAQTLYEGVELSDRGLTGLITYMRTDSVRLSDEAVQAGRAYIEENFGAEYRPREPRVFKTKGSAQDAHEAIRPTDVTLTPAELKGDLTNDQYRVYKLIWERFVSCQMAAAVYNTISVEITAGTNGGEHLFRASGQTLKFAGYTALYEEKSDDEEKAVTLPELAEGDRLKLVSMESDQHFTEPPPRYNEASLIKTMEEKGIGRPSTYAPTISTILDRDYIEREGKTLRPTPLGETVTDLMVKRFPDIVNVKFTAGMEDSLDRVESGEEPWKKLIGGFYEGFSEELSRAEKEMTERVQVPAEESDEVCELCGRKMVIKSGRFGKFLACPGYPECKNTKPIVDDTGAKCPICGGRIIRRFSKKKRAFFLCENNHGQDKGCAFITWDTPLAETCPECGKNLFRHSFRGERDIRCLNEGCGYKRETKEKEA